MSPTEPPTRPPAGTARAIGVVTAVAVLAVTLVMGAARLVPQRTDGRVGEVVVLVPGESVEGVLRGEPAAYAVEGRSGDVLIVDLRRRGGDLDPHLLVLDPSGAVLAEDDDGGLELDARLRVTLEEDGVHTVLAGGWGRPRGGYALDVVLVDATGLGAPEVVLEDVVESRADAPAELTFDAVEGAMVTVTARLGGRPGAGGARGGDPYLRLHAPDGHLVGEDDDSGGNLDAELRVLLPATGTYRLEVDNLQDQLAAMRVRVEVVAPTA